MSPVVWRTPDGYFNMQAGNSVFDFEITEARPVDFWLQHLSEKAWFTDQHLEQFKVILAKDGLLNRSDFLNQSIGNRL